MTLASLMTLTILSSESLVTLIAPPVVGRGELLAVALAVTTLPLRPLTVVMRVTLGARTVMISQPLVMPPASHFRKSSCGDMWCTADCHKNR